MKRLYSLFAASLMLAVCAAPARSQCTFTVGMSEIEIVEQPEEDDGEESPGIEGDGWEEDVYWVHDFSQELEGQFLNAFREGRLGDLQSASLVASIGVGAGGARWMDSDDIGIRGAGRIPTNGDTRIRLDLISEYGSATIKPFLSGDGRIPMHYSDDGFVNSARLTLMFSDCSCANVAEAQWNQPGGGAFSDDANWLDLETPDEHASVAFDVGGTYTVSFVEARQNNTLRVTSGAMPTFALGGNTYTLNGQCGDGAVVTVDGLSSLGIEGGTVQASGDVLLDGIGALLGINDQGTLAALGDVRINAGPGDGLFVNDGGRLTSTNDFIAGGESGTAGLVSILGPQASFIAAGRVVLGQSGQGEFSVSEGAAEVNELVVSEQASSEG
ncbi:MAG TPA: hypothetical protein VKP65_04390, partial [Rhodothermales bacterium]|nr:hypothetical protein [Rhodothermales bacterium]